MKGKWAKGILDSKVAKIGYLDEAVVRGQITPSHIYKYDCQQTQKRPLFGTFSKSSSRANFSPKYRGPTKELDQEKISKHYKKERSFCFKKTEHKRFTEISAKLKSFVPGVGSYTDVDKGLSKLSPKPRALRRGRR